ncbi:universal stress protein [Calidifontibacter terrae]
MSVVVGFLATPEGEAAWVEGARQAKAHAVPLVVVPLDEQAAHRAAERPPEPEVQTIVAGALGGHDLTDAFLEFAEQVPATMLVIGLRRRSSVGKLILGSNAQRILLDSGVPVLAVKAG